MKTKFLSAMACSLALFAAACGSDSSTTTTANRGGNTGGRVPAGGGTAAAQWNQVIEERNCADATSCPAGAGFTVNSSGRYTSGRGATGNITADELNALIAAANAAVPSAASTLECDDMAADAGVTVTLTASASFIIYEGRSASTLCHQGDATCAIALKNAIDALAQKYDRPDSNGGGGGGGGGGVDASCANRVCGQRCSECDPIDPSCEIRSCDGDGRCVPGMIACTDQ